MELTPDLGRTWTKTAPLNDGRTLEAIQPAILAGRAGDAPFVRILCRTKQRRVAQSTSADGGKTWSPLELTDLPNPNSGIDAVTLADGRGLLVYNHTRSGRSPLNVAVTDDGTTWKAGPVLESEPGEYSYPAVIQASDGKVHVTYTWKRQRIRHVVLDPQQFVLTDLPAVAR
jgi:alpha-L-rhamnosidase